MHMAITTHTMMTTYILTNKPKDMRANQRIMIERWDLDLTIAFSLFIAIFNSNYAMLSAFFAVDQGES
jgi:hypothetical protein